MENSGLDQREAGPPGFRRGVRGFVRRKDRVHHRRVRVITRVQLCHPRVGVNEGGDREGKDSEPSGRMTRSRPEPRDHERDHTTDRTRLSTYPACYV